MHKAVALIVVVFTLGAQAASAQKPSVEGAVVVASEPGKAAVVAMAEITATVVAIDNATRALTLKGPKGRTVDVIAGDAVKNFDQIRVGDRVTAQYRQALTLELKKARTAGGATETLVAARAKPGDRPAGVVGREITVLADVVAVDPKKSIISLKGPRGNVIDLNVQNPAQFKVVRVGDQVEAVYSEALAMAITPAKKAAEKK